MSVYTDNQYHPDLFGGPKSSNGLSRVVFAQDFKTIQFTMTAAPVSIPYTAASGSFVLGETITESGSGATGVILFDTPTSPTDGTLILGSVTGTFAGGNTLTGGTSTTTATSGTPTLASFSFGVIKSNQFLPPDPSLPASNTNQWSYLPYTDEATQTPYFTPNSSFDFGTSVTDTITFNVETTGSRWVWIVVYNYVSGTIQVCNMELFSNFN